MTEHLTDTFGRKHRYLRISLTDKCNFRCTYCMPDEQMNFMDDGRLMTASEVIDLATVFRELGVEKVRLTGGEPTLRKDLSDIVRGLARMGLTPSMTTNGALLHRHLDELQGQGVRDLNISIDSLQREKFLRISQRDQLDRVLQNIVEASRRGFKLKLNTVLIRNFNEDEILDLIRYASDLGAEARFIEYMPFFGNQWEYDKVFTRREVLAILEPYVPLPLKSPADSTAERYELTGTGHRFGIIPTVTQPFCQACSRLRLTADGKMKNCLFSVDESDLLSALRRGEDVRELIMQNVQRKKSSAGGRIDFSDEQAALDFARNRSMITIGG